MFASVLASAFFASALVVGTVTDAVSTAKRFAVTQNGDQKVRREFVFENPGEGIASAEPSGDQHIVFKDEAGRPVKYYHTVTDTWADAEKIVPNRRFSPLVWAIVAGYFAVIVLMGVFFARKEKTSSSFFRGGGRIPWYVAGVSLFATMLSSVTFLSVPALAYISDWRLWQNCLLGQAIVIPVAILFYMPVFRRMNLTSAYEYLERRFNLATRLFSSGVFVAFMVLRVAIVTLLPAIAIDAVTGIGIDFSIAVCGVVTILYCSFGGLEAVIWSDFLQGVVLMGGALLILVWLIAGTDGGLSGFLALGSATGKLRCFDFSPSLAELTFWVALSLGVTQTLFSYTSDQCVVQRYIAVKDDRAAARSMSFNAVLSIVGITVFFAIGSALWTHYRCHPELLDPRMPKNDAIFPHFIGMELPPAVAGLVIAAVFAATISTLSANLSAASSALVTDFYVRFRPWADERTRVRLGQICVASCGVVGTLAAFTLAHVDMRSLCDLFQEVISTVTAGVAGVFFLGVFAPCVGGRAAIAGLAVNYCVCFALKFGGLAGRFGIHPFMIGGVGLVSCIATGLALSAFNLRRSK